MDAITPTSRPAPPQAAYPHRSSKYQTAVLSCRSKRPDGETSCLAGARGDASVVGMKPAPGHQLHRQLTQLQRYRTHLFVGGQTSSLLRSKKTLLTPRMPENLAPRSTNAATLFRALLLQGKTRVVYLGLPRVTGRHAAWLQTPPLTQKNTISTTVGGMKFCTCPHSRKKWQLVLSAHRPTLFTLLRPLSCSPVLLFSISSGGDNSSVQQKRSPHRPP